MSGDRVDAEIDVIDAEIARLRSKRQALARRRPARDRPVDRSDLSTTALLKTEIDRLAEDSDYGARHEIVVSTVATVRSIDEELVEEHIARLRRVGEIYEPREGFWRLP